MIVYGCNSIHSAADEDTPAPILCQKNSLRVPPTFVNRRLALTDPKFVPLLTTSPRGNVLSTPIAPISLTSFLFALLLSRPLNYISQSRNYPGFSLPADPPCASLSFSRWPLYVSSFCDRVQSAFSEDFATSSPYTHLGKLSCSSA